MSIYPTKSYPVIKGLSEFEILKASHKYVLWGVGGVSYYDSLGLTLFGYIYIGFFARTRTQAKIKITRTKKGSGQGQSQVLERRLGKTS